MSALTRIFNNQIYNATIVASQKIAPGTITGSLFSSNVTVPGDLLISGNLFVLGTSAYTTIASTNTYVNDPLIVLNNGFSGSNNRDEGLIFNRGTDQNQAIIWSEVFDEFRLIATNEDGTTYGNITAAGLARLSIGSLNVPGQANIGVLSTTGAITGASLNVSGNVLATAGIYNELTVNGNETVTGYLNVTGNILASQARLNYLDVNGNVDLGLAGAVSGSWVNVIGNITQTSSGGAVYFNTAGNVLATAGTFNALTVNGNESVTGYLNVTGNVMGAAATFSSVLSNGVINTSGNVLAAAGTFNSLTVNGNESITGYLNVTGNVLTASLSTGQINTTGNVLATAGVFNELTVNGNESITGYLNVTGNVMSAGAIHNYLDVNGNVDLGLAGAISGSWVNVIGNITQTSSGGAVYFNTTGNVSAAAGAFGAITSTGYINTSGNISTAQLNAGQINTTGNVLATAGIFNELTVNGNESVTGYLNVTGNILGAAGTLSGLTVNGNESVTGYLNVTGNVLASTVGASYVTASTATFGNISAGTIGNAGTIITGLTGAFSGNVIGGLAQFAAINNTPIGNATASTGAFTVLSAANNLWANASIATTAQGIGAIVVPNGGISVAGAANIAGAITTAGAAQFNSTVTVGGIEYITNTTNATEATGSSGALQIKGGASIARDLHIGGNIYAANIFSTTYQVLTIQDPLVYFDAANTYPYNYDIGFYSNFVGPNPLDNTGNVYQHSGVVRDNADNTWKFFSNVRTEPSGAEITFDVNTIYDPVKAGNLVLTYTQAATSTGTGALQVAGGAGIAGTLVAAQLNSTGNVLGQAGTFNALTVNGNESVTGYLNVTGNVLTAQLNAGQINTTGNVVATAILASLITADDGTFGNVDAGFIGNVGTVFTGASVNLSGNILSTGAVHNSLTVNGNESVTGYLNVTGNVLAATGVFGAITSTGYINTSGNISAAQLNAGQINTTGNVLASTVGASFLTASTVAIGNISAVNFGNTGAIFSGASINLTGNVLASTVLASLVTADDATFGNVAAGFVGNTGTAYTGASINLSANVLAAAGVFNALTVNGNESVTGYLNVTGNVMTAQLNAGQINTTGNVLATAGVFNGLTVNGNESVTGYLNVTGNVLAATVGASFITASTAAVGNISAVTIGNSGATVTGTTAAFSGNVIGGLAQFASINATPIGNASASTGAFTTLSASAGIWANSTTASTSTTTGAVVVAGGIGLAGNIRAGGGAVINNSQTADPFQVKGVATTSLIYADTAYGAVVLGGSNVAPQLGSTLKINGTDSMLLPIGTTGQRPGATGNVDIAGMIRFNTTIQNMEFYDGTQWQTSGSVFTVISDRQFVGNVAGGFGNVDGTNTNFTIQANSTTAGTIVSINGVLQFPTLAYSVSGTTLTFTEPPAPDDVIDARVLTTTTTVDTLASGSGLQQFIASNDAAEIWTGVASTTKQIQINKVGDFEYLTGGKTTYTQTPVNIVANNTPYVIATYSQTAYTTAKFLISAKKGTTNFQSMETMVTTDGAGNAYITTYAVVNNGTDMGGITANVMGGNVQLYWTTTTNVTNANVKAMGTYIV